MVRSIDIEKKLLGKTIPLADADIAQVVAAFDKIIRPIDDQRSTAVIQKNSRLKSITLFS